MLRQAAQLFPDEESEQIAFLNSLVNPEDRKYRAVIWTKPEAKDCADFSVRSGDEVPSWLPGQISLLSPGESPGKSKLFEDGAIYPIDTSSVYTASAMLAAVPPRRILDVCAAPGGKSLFADSVFNPEFIFSNEVVGKRLGILRYNLKKSGRPNFYTGNLDPAELAEVAPEVFDLAIVDAPCSGQSLLAKGTENPGCFHPNIIKGNAKRQLRILSRSAQCVVAGGYLFYSTCTFARRENEGAIEKFLKHHGEFTPVEVPHLGEFQSELCDFPCYRIYPHRRKGAGGFTCLLRKDGDHQELAEIPEKLQVYPVTSD